MTEIQKKLPRILLLDWQGHYGFLEDESVKDKIQLVTFGGKDVLKAVLWYHPTANNFASKIAETVKQETYDLIILGNNQGNGVEVAKLLPDEAKAKTVVTSHIGCNETGYRQAGITRFHTRHELPKVLEQLVAQQDG
jgi:hypothetical protein